MHGCNALSKTSTSVWVDIVVIRKAQVFIISIFPLCRSIPIVDSRPCILSSEPDFSLFAQLPRDVLRIIMFDALTDVSYTLFNLKCAFKIAHICVRLGIYKLLAEDKYITDVIKSIFDRNSYRSLLCQFEIRMYSPISWNLFWTGFTGAGANAIMNGTTYNISGGHLFRWTNAMCRCHLLTDYKYRRECRCNNFVPSGWHNISHRKRYAFSLCDMNFDPGTRFVQGDEVPLDLKPNIRMCSGMDDEFLAFVDKFDASVKKSLMDLQDSPFL